ncbi:HGGxSTG domain-containing protein [Marimonas sp. MJW-29]|uniref:HGGxSTG domain-containing protein n=1 Tax=Sulfitobacter sediminis TaxID=3234186 RepID=A0ABV3RK67_9RHOB
MGRRSRWFTELIERIRSEVENETRSRLCSSCRLCPATKDLPIDKHRYCYVCDSSSCQTLYQKGIGDDGSPLPKKKRPDCSAKTRSGTLCKAKVVPGKKRCRLHGGLSTGPKSKEGRERIAQAQRQRHARSSKRKSG